MRNEKKANSTNTVLLLVIALVAMGLVVVGWVYREVPTASYAIGGVLTVLVLVWAKLNATALVALLRSRPAKEGANSLVTIGLVVAILVVVNFLSFKHFYRKDLTGKKTQTMSEQTLKILKDINQELKFTVYIKSTERDAVRRVLDNFKYSSKFIVVDYVDPDTDRNRAMAANVKKYGTVVITSGTRESRVESITEEKLINGVLKVLKEKRVAVCFLTGHGERAIDVLDADSLSQLKKDLESQNYESRTLNLIQDAKIADDCTILAVIGANRSFVDKELAIIQSWLDAGGRAFFALDPNLRSVAETSGDLKKLLADWFVVVNHDLILDPTSKLLGVNATVPIISEYSKSHPVSKEMTVTALFPQTSSVELKSNPPASLKPAWLMKSSPRSVAKSDFKEIMSGQVVVNEKKDRMGPFVLAAAVEGSRSSENKPKQASRLIVFGSSQVASNRWLAHGANSDVVMNSFSWLADDENLISIRPKEDDMQVPTVSEVQARILQLLTLIVFPLVSVVAGVIVFIRRRRA